MWLARTRARVADATVGRNGQIADVFDCDDVFSAWIEAFEWQRIMLRESCWFEEGEGPRTEDASQRQRERGTWVCRFAQRRTHQVSGTTSSTLGTAIASHSVAIQRRGERFRRCTRLARVVVCSGAQPWALIITVTLLVLLR